MDTVTLPSGKKLAVRRLSPLETLCFGLSPWNPLSSGRGMAGVPERPVGCPPEVWEQIKHQYKGHGISDEEQKEFEQRAFTMMRAAADIDPATLDAADQVHLYEVLIGKHLFPPGFKEFLESKIGLLIRADAREHGVSVSEFLHEDDPLKAVILDMATAHLNRTPEDTPDAE